MRKVKVIATVVKVKEEWDSFICDYWNALACDPNNWTYKSSTFGVNGVELVGTMHMILWDEMDAWINPGRKFGIDIKKLEELKLDIEREGIDTDKPIVYYDIDTNELINGAHRKIASSAFDIPGWMAQGVRFKNKSAKIRFANQSNKKRKDIYSPPDAKSIECSVRELMANPDESGVITDQDIKNEVRSLGEGAIKEWKISDIANKLITERLYNGSVAGGERFNTWSRDSFNLFLKNSDDPWIDNVYNNPSAFCVYINMRDWSARIGPLMSAAEAAVIAKKPLHLLISVELKILEQPDTSRQKVFDENLKTIERQICKIVGLDVDRCDNMFPWNHSDCQHRALPQDTENESPYSTVEI